MEGFPGFVVPLFRSATSDNKLYVQTIGPHDRVRGFEPIEIGDAPIVPVTGSLPRSPGDASLWGLQFADGTCAIEERHALGEILHQSEHRFAPLLQLQIATLLEAQNIAGHFANAFQFMQETAPSSVGIWRDIVMLLPRVRRAVLAARTRSDRELTATVSAIDLVSRGDAARIEVPEDLLETIGGEPEFRTLLGPLEEIFQALGIRIVEIQRGISAMPNVEQDSDDDALALILVHCTSSELARSSRRLRDAHHLFQTDILTDEGVVAHERLGRVRGTAIILVDDEADSAKVAATVAQALSKAGTSVGTLVLPGSREQVAPQLDPVGHGRHLAELVPNVSWLAFVGDAGREGDFISDLASNPHVDRQWADVTRWTPHALRACLKAGDVGRRALQMLTRPEAESKGVSIASGVSRGKTAATLATQAALAATKHTECPAALAQQIVLVAFHNRPLGGETLNQIEHAARAWNPRARLVVVEEHRDDLVKRVRVIAFGREPRTRPDHSHSHSPNYLPPPEFMPVVRVGWKIRPRFASPRRSIPSIEHARTLYTLKYEPNLVLTLDMVDAILESTAMHDGPVALLVQRIVDASAVQWLLGAGIFCAEVRNPRAFDHFGHLPGLAILSALGNCSDAEICERLSHFAGHFALGGLWRLGQDWELDGLGIHSQWMTGAYALEPRLEQFRLYRRIKTGVCYFRGIIRLDGGEPAVPRLRYHFGIALGPDGFRGTSLKPAEGEFDIRGEVRRRILLNRTERHRQFPQSREAKRNAATGARSMQLELPLRMSGEKAKPSDDPGEV